MSETQSRPKVSSAAPRAQDARPDRRKGGDRRKSPDPRPAPGLGAADVVGLLAEEPSLIEPGLEVYSQDGEATGVGFGTAVGDIDLLARDDSGAWVVIQVAEPDAGKELVGELLQRIGWVRRHLGSSGEEVRGIVLLDSLPDDLGYAAAAVSDTIEFKLYQLQLTFESVIL